MTKKRITKAIQETKDDYACSCNYNQADIEKLARAIGYSEEDHKLKIQEKNTTRVKK